MESVVNANQNLSTLLVGRNPVVRVCVGGGEEGGVCVCGGGGGGGRGACKAMTTARNILFSCF